MVKDTENPNFGWCSYKMHFFFIYGVGCHQMFITDVGKVILGISENHMSSRIKMVWKTCGFHVSLKLLLPQQ